MLATIIGMCGSILVVVSKSYVISMVAWGLLGLTTGIAVSSMSVTTATLLGHQHLATGLGICMSLNGVGNLVGGPVNGKQT